MHCEHEPSIRDLLELEEWNQHRLLRQEIQAREIPWPGADQERGIIICGGGEKYLPGVWVLLRELRCVGCTLPVEVWYLGEEEIPVAWAQRLGAELDVFLVDANVVRERHPVRILNGWELKVYALLHSRFREVLLLDADNVPVADPGYLFDLPEVRRLGAMFWPDYGRLAPERPIWMICDLPYRDEPEFETGQVLVNRETCWRELVLTMHLNEYSDFYYRYIHGDKETFHLAWRILGTPYVMPWRGIHSLPGTMCQHDLAGQRLFQHRNGHKWKLHDNMRVPEFINEERCLQHLRELSRLLDGEGTPAWPEGGETEGNFIYERIGYDQRLMALLPDGRIGKGSGGCERSWAIREGTLSLTGEHGCIAQLKWEGDRWAGRWLQFEKMPVSLRPCGPVPPGLEGVFPQDPSRGEDAGPLLPVHLGVIIPTVNRADLLQECLACLAGQSHDLAGVLVIDNGQQGLGEEHGWIRVLPMPHNLGVAASWNLGLRTFFEDPAITHVLALNDDITLNGGQISQIKATIRANPEKWMLTGPYQWSVWALSREGYQAMCGEAGYCFDEGFYPAYFEDNDFHHRISHLFPGRYLGLLPALEPAVLRSTMSGARDPSLLAQFKENEARYAAKWGGPPGAERIFPQPAGEPAGQQAMPFYEAKCSTPSDINEHLPVLLRYGSECARITEFGVRSIVSTWAFLAARPASLDSYDIDLPPNLALVETCAAQDGVHFTFHLKDVIAPDLVVPPTDLLFIDTLHTCAQLRQELERHGDQAEKYIILHDTVTFGRQDEGNPGGPGLLPALDEFLETHPWWTRHEVLENNNGLTVLRRQGTW